MLEIELPATMPLLSAVTRRCKDHLRRRQATSFLRDHTRLEGDAPSAFFSSGDLRRQELLKINPVENETEVNHGAQRVDTELKIASLTLGLATAGSLIYPPLRLLSLPGMVWVFTPVFKDAYQSFAENGHVGMKALDTLFVVGTIVTNNIFAGALGTLTHSLSRKLLSQTEDHSRTSLANVFGRQPRFAWMRRGDLEVEVPCETLEIGDIVIVNAGGYIPIDGTIVSGAASIDQQLLTGESQPAEKGVGEFVLASTVVLSGRISIAVEKTGADTVAAHIAAILRDTADFKSLLRSRGEAMADQSTPPTLALSALTLPFLGPTAAVTILNSCMGFRMKILGPLSMLTFLNLAAQKGILVKDGRSLQLLKDVDTIVFDKTGTLTVDQLHVGEIYLCDGHSENELLTWAAAAEYRQSHPVAQAILRAAHERGLPLPEVDEAQYEIGYGIKVKIGDQLIRVGSARFIEMEAISIDADIQQQCEASQAQGDSCVYVAIDQRLAGAIALQPTLRPETKRVIRQLSQLGMSLYIVSGDKQQATRKLAEEVGIEHYFAEVLPSQKAEIVQQLQKEGKVVCFIGDGINDSIALKQADVSISISGAAAVATDTAQMVLINQGIDALIDIFDVGQHYDTNMNINFLMTIVPGLMTIGGVFFLHFGIVYSILLNNLGMVAGASNAMWPSIKNRKQNV